VKRLLQGLAVLQFVLAIALAVRVVGVWTTPLPAFPDVPELPAESELPPPRPVPKIPATVTDAVVEHDLFDEQRGVKDAIEFEDPSTMVPVAPPATVKLMGVMLIGGEPVGILLDTNLKPDQQSVRKGDMFGEYEVGEITRDNLTLIGSGNQQFQVPLRIDATAAAAMPPPQPGPAARPTAPPIPGARPPVTPPHPSAIAGKPVSARPAAGHDAGAAPEQKTMSARERAQAIAQRNADLRKTGAKAPGGAEGENNQGAAKPDPVQARLEALRALREAAKNH
jgi:hypothetical protein